MKGYLILKLRARWRITGRWCEGIHHISYLQLLFEDLEGSVRRRLSVAFHSDTAKDMVVLRCYSVPQKDRFW
jgi:hypothetical protein